MSMNNQGRPSGAVGGGESSQAETFSGHKGLRLAEPLIYEIGCTSTTGVDVADVGELDLALGGLERTAEIGLLNALGATRRQITALFLMESAILSLIGAGVGIILGYIILLLIQQHYPEFPLTLPLWAVGLALIVALSTALIFSIFPATKAARLNPITALHKR